MTASRRTLTTASLGTMVALVAFTAPLATVNLTVAGLGAGTSGRTWILSSMSIGLGAFLLTAGRVADDFGRRRTFVAGTYVLVAGSLLGAVAPEVVTFVVARIVQGVGAAAMIAAGLGMIAVAFPDPQERAHATGVWGASVGAGIALGPLLSSGLAKVGSWRDVYVVLVAAGVGLALTARGCDESRVGHRARLDVPGVVLLALGMAAGLAGLTEGREGWGRPLVVGLLGPGSCCSRPSSSSSSAPTTPCSTSDCSGGPAFAAVTLAAVATGGGIIALLSYLSGFVGVALGLSSWTAAWLMLAWSGTSVVTALAARRLPTAWSGRARLSATLVVVGAGQLLLWHIVPGDGAARFVPGLLLAGVGSGVLNAALGRESVASVPAGQGGLGSGANNTARYLGSALGVTVVSIVAAPSGVVTSAALVDGWNRAVLVTVAVSMVGALAVLVVGRPRPGPEPSGPVESARIGSSAWSGSELP